MRKMSIHPAFKTASIHPVRLKNNLKFYSPFDETDRQMTLAATSHLDDQDLHLMRLGEVFFRTGQVFFQNFGLNARRLIFMDWNTPSRQSETVPQ